MLCGCISTSIISGEKPKRRCASKTSSPLFINVAESIVIFFPISQLGCFRASSIVTLFNSLLLLPRNGPPDAVSTTLFTDSLLRPSMHWNIALCSLSTGIIFAPDFAASLITISPATTSDSLLASPIVFPALTAESVGKRPANPIIAERTKSALLYDATSAMPLSPESTLIPSFFLSSKAHVPSATAAISGLNALICSSSSSMLFLAVSPTTLNLSRYLAITSSALRPMEPVEPKIVICFILLSRMLKQSNKAQALQKERCQSYPVCRRAPALCCLSLSHPRHA